MLSGRKVRSPMNFADKDEGHGPSVSTHLLVKVYSEDKLALFNSGAIPKFMPKSMVFKLNIRIAPTRRRIKFANGDSESCLRALTDTSASMGEMNVALDFIVI